MSNKLELVWNPTQSEIERITNEIVLPVLNGYTPVEKTFTALIALQKSIDDAVDRLKPTALEWMKQYPKGQQPVALGVTFELAEAGVKYDYSSCNHPEYNRLKDEVAPKLQRMKELEDMLRKLKAMEVIVDKITGDIVEVNPPQKKSTTTFKKQFPNG